MADRSEPGNFHKNEPAQPGAPGRTGPLPQIDAAPIFNPKGIESNIVLTAAAAIVPLMIVGIATAKTILGVRKKRR